MLTIEGGVVYYISYNKVFGDMQPLVLEEAECEWFLSGEIDKVIVFESHLCVVTMFSIP